MTIAERGVSECEGSFFDAAEIFSDRVSIPETLARRVVRAKVTVLETGRARNETQQEKSNAFHGDREGH